MPISLFSLFSFEQDTWWHLSQMYATASLDLCRRERKKERTGPDRIQRMNGQERTIFGPRHNTVSFLCQTGLDRRTGDIGWGNDVFVLVGACCCEIEYIAIGARETHARSAPLSPTVGPALLQTTINSWVILIATPRTRSGRPGLSLVRSG